MPRINRRSQRIIGRPPTIVFRFGSGLVGAVIAGILCIAFFVRVSEQVIADGTLTTEGLPIIVSSPVSGHVSELLVANGESINQDDPLLTLINRDTVAEIDRVLSRLHLISEELESGSIPGDLVAKVGTASRPLEVIEVLSNLAISANAYVLDFSDELYASQRDAMHARIEQSQQRRQILSDQLSLAQQRLAFSRDIRAARDELSTQGLGSRLAYFEAEMNEIENAVAASSIELAIADSVSLIQETEILLIELELQRASALTSLIEEFRLARNQIHEWRNQQIILSPISGRAEFGNELRANLFVNIGTPLLIILPQIEQASVEIFVDQTNFGAVAVGQEVQMRLPAFPYEQYGYLAGTVSNISEVPDNSRYRISIEIGELQLSTGRHVEFRGEMQVEARIITERKRILVQLFEAAIRQVG